MAEAALRTAGLADCREAWVSALIEVLTRTRAWSVWSMIPSARPSWARFKSGSPTGRSMSAYPSS